MGRQDQTVEEGGEAYQGGRDVVVHKGMSPQQMSEIMVALAGQLKTFLDTAESKAEVRYQELRESIIAEFARDSTKAKPEAFSEPDYQRVVQEAQESYVRSGDAGLKAELVRLLAERSTKPTGSRLSMVLNEAIRTAGSLTSEEYAALSAIFLFKYAKINGRASEIEDRLGSYVQTFIEDLPSSEGSYEYLQTLRCISVSPLGTPLWSAIQETYASDFSLGFSLRDLADAAGSEELVKDVTPLTVLSSAHFGGNIRFDVKDSEQLRQKLEDLGIDAQARIRLIALFDKSRPAEITLKDELSARVPALAQLNDIWEKTPLQQATLTALGKALAHSALVNRIGLSAPLEIWVT